MKSEEKKPFFSGSVVAASAQDNSSFVRAAALTTAYDYGRAEAYARGAANELVVGNNDIYVFDPALDTVLAIVGVNTLDNEFNPRISDNGKWLVFQRTWGTGDCGCSYGYGNQDILLYNMDMKLVNTLPGLNTEAFDEYMPDVSDDGCKIVYVTEVGHFAEVRLYDTKTGDNWAIPGASALPAVETRNSREEKIRVRRRPNRSPSCRRRPRRP